MRQLRTYLFGTRAHACPWLLPYNLLKTPQVCCSLIGRPSNQNLSMLARSAF